MIYRRCLTHNNNTTRSHIRSSDRYFFFINIYIQKKTTKIKKIDINLSCQIVQHREDIRIQNYFTNTLLANRNDFPRAKQIWIMVKKRIKWIL